MRRVSKTSKKGCLERIYKQWTLSQVLKKNNGICVCCKKNKADTGHHIFRRVKDFYHIHPDFVVPVCLVCHSQEKSLKHENREGFLVDCESWHMDHINEYDVMVRDFLVCEDEDSQELKDWANNKLLEFGYQWR